MTIFCYSWQPLNSDNNGLCKLDKDNKLLTLSLAPNLIVVQWDVSVHDNVLIMQNIDDWQSKIQHFDNVWELRDRWLPKKTHKTKKQKKAGGALVETLDPFPQTDGPRVMGGTRLLKASCVHGRCTSLRYRPPVKTFTSPKQML